MKTYLDMDEILRHCRANYRYIGKEDDEHYLVSAVPEEVIRSLPPADVMEVRHGHWVNRWICSNMTEYEYACSCSECNKSTYRISTLEPMPPYCPNCGAKMDEETNE